MLRGGCAMEPSPTECLANALAAIEPATCDAFAQSMPRLVAFAYQRGAHRADTGDLLGFVADDILHTDLAEYANLIYSQLRLKTPQALIEDLAWVYRTYMQRGVSLRHFPLDLAVWCDAADQLLDAQSAAQIKRVYGCMGMLHGWLTEHASTSPASRAIDAELAPLFQGYIAALLKPDMAEAIHITSEYVTSPARLSTWWEHVIQPAMYEIGDRWAHGEITVGQEHLATAITQRVMAIHYPLILELPREKGAIVVAASPGEMHEIGPRLVADLLEVGGWDVYFTGANTPAASVVALIEQTRARVLAISTTLTTSLPAVATLIAQVRQACRPAPHILVGGQAYTSSPELWRQIGADGFAASARSGCDYIEAYQQSAGKL